ncbi:pentatricopeptide repeat-containing protein At4g21065-like [Chenopodium quinoa]|uniref:DYW domain-containing protein n=1 Tax=Chenopodium quinoa TaxID=63459 RepID=A0A803LPB3_CHEQI|nr:pentatricopeptide repeat-containing protein At4g21065-like [Chenopodium quinoa]
MEVTTMSQAMQLHAQALKSGAQPHHQNYSKLFTFSALSPSGDLNYARLILDCLPTPNSYYWNTMIRAYCESSDPYQSIFLFLAMHNDQSHGFVPKPDKFTYPFVLKACGRLRDTQLGKQVHCLICKMGFESDKYVCNSLIHMYGKCSDLGCARKVFDNMLERDVVAWTSMIDGLVDNGRAVEAIRLFEEMVECGVEPNDATIVSVLRGCAEAGAFEVGRRAHRIVEEQGIGLMANVSTALIDMYCKCGCIDSAREVFDKVLDKDVCAWTAMIHGLASHGMIKEAIDSFEEMKKSGVMPDEQTMTAVLAACRNAGWVTEAYRYFEEMRKKYGIKPNLQHHGCIVDLYARSGQLDEAEDFIRKMLIRPDAVLWRTVVWACKIHGDNDRAERLIKEMNVYFDDCGSYVLLSNIYASAGKWHDKAICRETMSRQGLVKTPGSSKIEVDGSVHDFTAGDSSHIEAHNIYKKLEEIYERLREEGYKPEISEVLLEVDDDEKATQLLHHSEKLAVAFGLMKMKPGSQIRIVKNLRSCEDCHSFMKLISRVYEREIIVRDRIRFHHFRNGVCSCGDYW